MLKTVPLFVLIQSKPDDSVQRPDDLFRKKEKILFLLEKELKKYVMSCLNVMRC